MPDIKIHRAIGVVLFAALSVLQTGSRVAAHELERTAVFATFSDDGTYLIDVMNDPDWLLARVEPFSGLPPSGRLDSPRRAVRLAELTGTFTERVSLYFDDVRVDVTAEYIPVDPNLPVDPDDPPLGTMRLQGQIPEDARTFRWSYGYIMDPYPMLIQAGEGEWITSWVNGQNDSETFEFMALRPPTRWMVAQTYLGLGFTHILPKGLDHILFVIGIYLLSPRWRPIVAQVSTFTIAHTITLGLTIYGVLSLPSRVVEPLIALSIAYVAIENLVTSELKPWRIALVFGFGLLHGMGFAGVLANLGLPQSEFLAALLSFNLGVEVGQLVVIGMMFVAIGRLRNKAWYRQAAVVPLSVLIAAVGLYWTVTRLVGS
jgi:hydrogenase/urease accessory protein HupE